ncbi:MAG: cadherin-like domain-containing protein [Aquabacterium sp.]|nr:cadherin-like domain-containing protein [Aquabacterium sp.]
MSVLGTDVIVGLTQSIAHSNTLKLPQSTDFTKLLARDASGAEIASHLFFATLKYNPITLAAEGAYRMTEAAMKGDWDEARDNFVNLLALVASVKYADTPALRRDLQRAAKQVDFLMQQMRRGVIEVTPLRDLLVRDTNTKAYVIESSTRDVSGTPVSESRVIDVEDYAKACEGTLKINEDGTVDYRACFVAGTPVHTDQGLLPIEDVRAGTLVLSQSEEGGEIGYRRVIKKVAHLDQPVYAVQIEVEGGQELTTVIATPNHPFWVEGPLTHGEHWMATEYLEPGFVLQLADGRKAHVHAAGRIRRTQYEHIAFAADDRTGVGIVLDTSDAQIKVADRATSLNLGKLDLGQSYLAPVYNFEVDEFHTYYVGEAGVWVHNTNCPVGGQSITEAIAEKAELQSVCFDGDTPILRDNGSFSKIENLEVGSVVMSRCEKTGEMTPKRVIRIYEHIAKTYALAYKPGPLHLKRFPSPGYIYVTGEHPCWVEGKGWTPVCELKPGDAFLTHNGDPTTVDYVLTPDAFANSMLSGAVAYAGQVFNLEVEDFNTYFVGTPGIWVHNCNNVTPDINRISIDVVANPTPEWSPFHLSTERLQAALDNNITIKSGAQELKPEDIKIKIREATSDQVLGRADIRTLALPAEGESVSGAFESQLGKLNSFGQQAGWADRMLFSDKYPDLNGVAADIYQPNGKAGSIALEIRRKKAPNQASTIVLDLRYTSATLKEVLKYIDEGASPGEGPPPGLKTLLVIEKVGGVDRLTKIDYPDRIVDGRVVNEQVRGVATITADKLIVKRRTDPSTPVITRSYGPDTDSNAQYLEADTQGVAGTGQLSMPDVLGLLPAARQYWLNAGASASVLDSVDVTIGNLAPRIAAMTLGNEITLSADGAGWGWFVDATPTAQEEYGAGDAANEFQALAGSAAAGKMDLLTVLVHELGHVLGLGHVSGNDDLMAQFLMPGVRRIPSAVDMSALMANSATSHQSATQVIGTTYTLDAAEPTARSLVQAQQAGGWSAQGDVAFDNALTGAVLSESGSVQTNASQVLTYGAGDRYLSFTVDARGLQGNSSGASDAFEAALLNAGTMQAIGNTVSLTRSDALLNIQSNGQESLAQGIRKVANADGSNTYYIDLPTALVNTPVYLSFDLIGFGATQSSVALRDVRLVRDPLATNDQATLDEDTSSTIQALANDLPFEATAPTLELVNGPAHGSVVINSADGAFTYQPNANYNGADSFSYRFVEAGSGKASNVAQVNLTVRSVNDLPAVTADRVFEVVAGKGYELNPLESVQDVDGDVLTAQLVDAPLHGTFTVLPGSSWLNCSVYAASDAAA